ncbi:MAG: hypothetical protein ACTSXT_08190 [Candidatus Helarchaeota archaeon]
MTSAEVKKYYDNDEMKKLYKICEKYFNRIDEWADKMIDGDLMSEYDLKYAQQQLNGCQTKLNPVAGALEALLIEYENNFIVEEESKFEKLRIQDQNSCKAVARKKVSELRRYASDFTRYVYSAQSAVTTAQSLLKRMTIEKGNKNLDFTGDKSNTNKETDW